MKQLEHQKDLFKKLIESECFRKEMSIFEPLFKDSVWWIAEENTKPPLISLEKFKQCVCKKKHVSKDFCVRKLSSLIKKAKKTKKPVFFDCGSGKNGVCFPVVQGDRVYGYILICHSKNELSPELISVFSNLIDTLLI